MEASAESSPAHGYLRLPALECVADLVGIAPPPPAPPAPKAKGVRRTLGPFFFFGIQVRQEAHTPGRFGPDWPRAPHAVCRVLQLAWAALPPGERAPYAAAAAADSYRYNVVYKAWRAAAPPGAAPPPEAAARPALPPLSPGVAAAVAAAAAAVAAAAPPEPAAPRAARAPARPRAGGGAAGGGAPRPKRERLEYGPADSPPPPARAPTPGEELLRVLAAALEAAPGTRAVDVRLHLPPGAAAGLLAAAAAAPRRAVELPCLPPVVELPGLQSAVELPCLLGAPTPPRSASAGAAAAAAMAADPSAAAVAAAERGAAGAEPLPVLFNFGDGLPDLFLSISPGARAAVPP